MIKRLFTVSLLLLAMSVSAFSQNEVITNQLIQELLQEGWSESEIISQIENTSERNITTDISAVRKLKQAGASQGFIQYLQKISKTDFGYEGVLWWNPSDGGKPHKLYRTSLEMEETKASGFGIGMVARAVTSGSRYGSAASRIGNAASWTLFSSSGGMEKVVMQGAHARIVLRGANGTNPVFRFYFPKEQTNSFSQGDSWYYSMMKDIESPNEFQCVKLKEKKNKRTFPSGMRYTAAGITQTKSSRDIVDFEIKNITNNIFEVTFPNGLEPGEYCFLYKNGMNNHYFQENMFAFDFSVQ